LVCDEAAAAAVLVDDLKLSGEALMAITDVFGLNRLLMLVIIILPILLA